MSKSIEFDGWLSPPRKRLSLQELCLEFLCLNHHRIPLTSKSILSADIKETLWNLFHQRRLHSDQNIKWFDLSREAAVGNAHLFSIKFLTFVHFLL